MKMLIELPDMLHKRLKRQAIDEGIFLKELVLRLIEKR